MIRKEKCFDILCLQLSKPILYDYGTNNYQNKPPIQ